MYSSTKTDGKCSKRMEAYDKSNFKLNDAIGLLFF